MQQPGIGYWCREKRRGEQLLREFRGHGNAVLLGTASFWEGVDVQGPALRLVVIDRLPFASPDDPVLARTPAACARARRQSFNDVQVPEAALALKQGVGRLIRSETDQGVVPSVIRASRDVAMDASCWPACHRCDARAISAKRASSCRHWFTGASEMRRA